MDMKSLLQHGIETVLQKVKDKIPESFGKETYKTVIANAIDTQVRDKIGNNSGIVDLSIAGPDNLLVSYY